MTRIKQVAVGNVEHGQVFCDADTDDVATDAQLNEWYNAEELLDVAVTLVRSTGYSVLVQDREGRRREILINDWSQIVWLLEKEE